MGDIELDQQKRLISCKFNDINILNLYVPHGDERGSDKYNYKMKWYKTFLEYLEERYNPTDHLLVVGDFNVAFKDMDVYDSRALRDAVCTMPEERQALQEIADWGLVDTYRYLYPEEVAYTWWSYMGGSIWKDEGMRIDYIFCTHPMLDRLISTEIDIWPRRRRKPTPSDHAPVISEFNYG